MNQAQRNKDGPTMIALFFLLLAALGLIILTSMVLPQMAVMIVVVGGFFVICLFHYLTWGRLLKPRQEENPEEEPEQ